MVANYRQKVQADSDEDSVDVIILKAIICNVYVYVSDMSLSDS